MDQQLADSGVKYVKTGVLGWDVRFATFSMIVRDARTEQEARDIAVSRALACGDDLRMTESTVRSYLHSVIFLGEEVVVYSGSVYRDVHDYFKTLKRVGGRDENPEWDGLRIIYHEAENLHKLVGFRLPVTSSI